MWTSIKTRLQDFRDCFKYCWKKSRGAKRENWYGWIPDKPDTRDQVFRLAEPIGLLPSKVDLSGVFPTCYNQGGVGCCVGEGVGGCFQYAFKKQNPQWNFDPSPLFIYWNARDYDDMTNSDSGTSIRNGIKALNSYGVCCENHWPLNPQKVFTKPGLFAYGEALFHKSLQYGRVNQTLDEMKAALAGGFPIVLGISIYESFETDEVAKTGVVNMPGPQERLMGGHCVILVGYQDEDKRFLMRNSWGDWGTNGYFTIPYDYLVNPNLCADLWAVQKVSGINF